MWQDEVKIEPTGWSCIGGASLDNEVFDNSLEILPTLASSLSKNGERTSTWERVVGRTSSVRMRFNGSEEFAMLVRGPS